MTQIPKSNQKFFDACPWPFTFFHAPIAAAKAGPTWVVIVWAVLCQIYSRLVKAKALGAAASTILV